MSVAADAKEQFRGFLALLPAGSRIAVVGHSDVDGLAATVITTRVFQRTGYSVEAYVTKKGENAWTGAVLDRVGAAKPSALAVVDLGSRSDTLLPGIPTIIIDHHKPTGIPEGATLISGYGSEPTPSSGLLAYWCAQSVDVERDLDWLAAASMLADYGDANGYPGTHLNLEGLGTTKLRRLTTLLNAPRRTSTGDANPTLDMLLHAPSAHAVLQGRNEEILLSAKAEVDAALQRARKVAPHFAGKVALITINEACQVHPLVAQTWLGRLKKHIVLCANTGYLPGRVNFAARTALSDNLLDFLQQHRPTGAGEDYGRGHDKATGGSLTVAQWREFLSAVGLQSVTPADHTGSRDALTSSPLD